jgi:hypothetical protein
MGIVGSYSHEAAGRRRTRIEGAPPVTFDSWCGPLAALVSLTAVVPATDFLTRTLQMLEGIGWIVAHGFLFAEIRAHLLGWPRFLVPHGCRIKLLPASSSS